MCRIPRKLWLIVIVDLTGRKLSTKQSTKMHKNSTKSWCVFMSIDLQSIRLSSIYVKFIYFICDLKIYMHSTRSIYSFDVCVYFFLSYRILSKRFGEFLLKAHKKTNEWKMKSIKQHNTPIWIEKKNSKNLKQKEITQLVSLGSIWNRCSCSVRTLLSTIRFPLRFLLAHTFNKMQWIFA